MHRMLTLMAAVAMVSPAVAQTPEAGTETGATALRGDLSAYLGRKVFDDGIVTVTPQPDGYRITVMFDAKLDGTQPGGATGTITLASYSTLVGKLPDGNWQVSSKDPLSFAYDIVFQGARSQAEYRIDAIDYSGIFSPALGSFLSAGGSSPASVTSQKDAVSHFTATTGRQVFDMKGSPNGMGAVDLDMTQTIQDYRQSMTVPVESPEKRVDMSFGSREIGFDAKGSALRSRALMDLYAFVAQHIEKDALASSQDELKRRLTAVLPLWDSLEGGYALADLEIDTPEGRFDVGKLDARFQGDGVEADATYRMTFDLDDVSLDSPLVPAWAAPLIPSELSFTTKVLAVDLAAPASTLIADFDLKRDPPVSAAAGEAILAHFSDKPPVFVIEPSRIKAEDYEVTLSGQFEFDAFPATVGSLTFEGTGIDKAVKRLQEAGKIDQQALAIVGPLSMAQGFAKRMPDGRLQWVLDYREDGSVALNGTQITGPDPATETGDPTP